MDVSLILLPLLVIVAGAALFRSLFQRMGQPAVLGEILLGIALGASLLGWLWPQAQAALFRPEAMAPLQALGWMGLAFFMFAVGTELRWRKGDAKAVSRLAIGAVALPLALGAGLAMAQPGWFFDGPPGLPQVALVAVILCVSALPVLARILEHHDLLRTRLGAVVLGSGALADGFAWAVLAVVIGASAVGLTGDFALNVAAVGAVFGGALWASRKLAPRLGGKEPGQGALALIVCAILGSAWLTHAAGLHALLGPLMVGAVVARHEAFASLVRTRLQGLTMILFLPAFFVLAGLDTNLTLLASSAGLSALVAVVAAASLGKLAGCWIGGRAAGLSRDESVAAGILLNARGAVDLVIAKIGYDAGLLSASGFALLVLMIVITTCAAGPALVAYQRWSQRQRRRQGLPSAVAGRGLPTPSAALAMTLPDADPGRAEPSHAVAPRKVPPS